MCRLLLLAFIGVFGVLATLGVSAQSTCKCPTPATKENFEAERYLGKWYEMKRVSRGFERGGQCGTAEYSWLDSTKTAVNVINTNYVPSLPASYKVNLKAEPTELKVGKFEVSWPSKPEVPLSKYWVLDTDYNTYSVVYSCGEPSGAADDLPSVTLWVLARDPNKFTSDVETTVEKLLKLRGFENINLDRIRHDCPAVECKPCTASKTGLDLDKLKGRWWQVQQSPFATGADKQSCGLADFSATKDGLKISVDTFERSNSADLSGKDTSMELVGKWKTADSKTGEFTVESGLNGDPNDRFCIIDTDYDNWAVLSVCGKDTKTSLPNDDGFTRSPLGGLYVLSRDRGLNSANQMKANRAVLTAGVAASSMEATPSTPCPMAAFITPSTPSPPSSAATSTVATALLLSALLSLRLTA